MTKTASHDWRRFDAMTDAEIHAAALADPDAQPLPEAACLGGGSDTLSRVPRATTLRRSLGLSEEDFATRYHIPLGTLRDWEQGRVEPDPTARAYLRAIAGDPQAVHHALQGPRANG